jgi:pimeloyl-ACP methyl ester carboxylesterase
VSKIKNIVLVHGFFTDASSYNEVTKALLADGYNVIAVQNPLRTFSDDVDTTRRALARVEGPCILVGHSWGGMVISEAGNDERVAGLVYIAALAPDENESMLDLLKAQESNPQYFEVPEGFMWISKEGVREFFINDASEEQIALLYATQAAPAMALSGEKVNTVPAWKNKPCWYLVAEDDRAIPPELQENFARKINARVSRVKSGHVPMITQPEAVYGVIREAAIGCEDQ